MNLAQSAFAVFALLAFWAGAVTAAPIERELHFIVTVDAQQTWKKNDPEHPGDQWSKATGHQRWELRTWLRSSGKLEVRDLLDPDLNTRLEAKTIYLARQAKYVIEQDTGKPFHIPRTEAEKTALGNNIEEQMMGCQGEPTCLKDLTMAYAAIMAAIEHPEAMEEDTVPGQYLYFLPYKGCPEQSHVTMDLAIDGVRYNKDAKKLVPFSERHAADTVNASDGSALCEHFTATLDTKNPKGMVRQETIFVPRPEGTTDYTEQDHTSHTPQPQPLVMPALEWANDVLRYAPASGTASASLPLALPLNANATWLGLWQGTAKVTLQWTFLDVTPAAATPQK